MPENREADFGFAHPAPKTGLRVRVFDGRMHETREPDLVFPLGDPGFRLDDHVSRKGELVRSRHESVFFVDAG